MKQTAKILINEILFAIQILEGNKLPSVAIIGTRGYPSYYGGFETAVRRLAPYLADEGWDVTVYGRDRMGLESADIADPRVKSVITKGFESKSLSTLSFGLSSILHASRIKPDVALVMNVANGFWLPLLRAAGVPTLVNVDGIEWERQKWGKVAKCVFRLGAKLTAKWATDLVFDAKQIESRWKSEFSRTGNFIPYGGDVLDADSELPLGLERRKYVLLVARFVPENTVIEFFDAVPEIAQRADVVIVGSSGYGGELDDRARELSNLNSNVHWLGHVRDDSLLHTLWQNAGAYFHGHSVGGTNPALVQAMALGSPVVARDTIYNREVLDDFGIYAEPTPASITCALFEVLEDSLLQERLSAAAVRRAREVYSWGAVNDGYHRALTSLATRRVKRHG